MLRTGFQTEAEPSPPPRDWWTGADGFINLGPSEPLAILTQSVGLPVHAVRPPPVPSAAESVMRLLRAVKQHTVLVSFVNPATAKLARHDPDFALSLSAFDLVLPDGIGLCLAIRLLHGLHAPRVSFDMTSLAPAVFEHARSGGLGVALVGGVSGVAAQARDRLTAHFPGLRIVGVFDGYGDRAGTVLQLAALQPDIVVCGMGAPRQEVFLLALKDQGWQGWGFTCGGFFDQLQTGLSYYPDWIDRSDLRWAYRLFREPSRLWRRYLLDYGEFGFLLADAVRRKVRHAGTDA